MDFITKLFSRREQASPDPQQFHLPINPTISPAATAHPSTGAPTIFQTKFTSTPTAPTTVQQTSKSSTPSPTAALTTVLTTPPSTPALTTAATTPPPPPTLTTPKTPTSLPPPTPSPTPNIVIRNLDKTLDKTKQLGTEGLNRATTQVAALPVSVLYGIFTVISILFLIFGVWVACKIRGKFRKFTKTDEGRELRDKLAENPYVGKYVWEAPPVPEDIELNPIVPEEVEPEPEEPEEETEFIGRLNYRLEFDFEENVLMVKINEVEELQGLKPGGTSDPFMVIFFCGDKKRFETKVHRKNVNPKFNETFYYRDMDFGDLMAKTLCFEIYDYEMFKTSEQIGEIQIRMCTIDLTTPVEGWLDFEAPMEDEEVPPGNICVSLRYAPAQDKLTLAVVECKALKAMDLMTGAADPFVKVRLYQDGNKFLKKQTTMKEANLNPYFNESFTYEIKPNHLSRYHFVLTVLDYNAIGPSDPIGRVAIGPKVENEEGKQHWKEMVKNPRRPITQWYALKEPDAEEFLPAEKKQK